MIHDFLIVPIVDSDSYELSLLLNGEPVVSGEGTFEELWSVASDWIGWGEA